MYLQQITTLRKYKQYQMHFNSSLLYLRTTVQQIIYQVNFLSRNEPNYFGLASRVRTLNPKVRRPILLHNKYVEGDVLIPV